MHQQRREGCTLEGRERKETVADRGSLCNHTSAFARKYTHTRTPSLFTKGIVSCKSNQALHLSQREPLGEG